MLISQLQLILTMLDKTIKIYFKHNIIKQKNYIDICLVFTNF